jgi:membrane-bound lytic murein transglycosylase A
MKRIFSLTSLALLLLVSVWIIDRRQQGSDQPVVALDSQIPDVDEKPIAKEQMVSSVGKLVTTPSKQNPQVFKQLYTKVSFDTLSMPSIDGKLLKALSHQVTLLKTNKQPSKQHFGELEVATEHMEQVIAAFKAAKKSSNLTGTLDAYQIAGDDRKGQVRFTGYYSPVIPARRRAEGEFRTPVYIKSKEDDGLEVCYVKDKTDIYSMKTEGIAYLIFPGGERKMLSFTGDYQRFVSEETTESKSPQKLLAAYAAVFNNKSNKSNPYGAYYIPLTPDYTIAVDRRFFPLGSVMLAQVPVVDNEGKLIRHEYRFLLPQDVGSAVKGSGHVDLYMGEGDWGKHKAQLFHQYGRLWLLMPKQSSDSGKQVAKNM